MSCVILLLMKDTASSLLCLVRNSTIPHEAVSFLFFYLAVQYVLYSNKACILFSKRNFDSCNKSCIMIVTEPTTPLIFHAQHSGTFLFMGCFMYQYPKQILTIAQQVQSYIDAEMEFVDQANVEKALKSVGYYRLRGYSFHLYDNATKKYIPGTKFEDILKLYQFDQELSALIFAMISKIEVALRVRLVEALLIHGEPLVLQESSIFKEKKLYWQNMSTVASEIAHSNNVFIKHNFDNNDGEVPVWATVEVLSFGTLSKIIKNLKTGIGSSYLDYIQ